MVANSPWFFYVSLKWEIHSLIISGFCGGCSKATITVGYMSALSNFQASIPVEPIYLVNVFFKIDLWMTILQLKY